MSLTLNRFSPPRARAALRHPTILRAAGDPLPVTAEIIAADLKVPRTGAPVLLECNGIKMGLSGYYRLFPEAPRATIDLKRVFMECLAARFTEVSVISDQLWHEQPHQGIFGFWSTPFVKGAQLYTLEQSQQRHQHLVAQWQWLENQWTTHDGAVITSEFSERLLSDAAALPFFSREAIHAIGEALQDMSHDGEIVNLETYCGIIEWPSYYVLAKQRSTAACHAVAESAVLITMHPEACRPDIFDTTPLCRLNVAAEIAYDNKLTLPALHSGSGLQLARRVHLSGRSTHFYQDLATFAAQSATGSVVLKVPDVDGGIATHVFPSESVVDGAAVLLGHAWRLGGTAPMDRLRTAMGIDPLTCYLFQAYAAEPYLVEEYVASEPIRSPHSGYWYDATMRFVYGVIAEGTQIEYFPLDAYWKLPPTPISQGRIARKRSDVYYGERTLPVADRHFDAVAAGFAAWLPAHLQARKQWLAQLPPLHGIK